MASQAPAPIPTGLAALHSSGMPRGLSGPRVWTTFSDVPSPYKSFPPTLSSRKDYPHSFFLYRKGNWGPEKEGNFSKTTHPASLQSKTWTQVFWLKAWCYPPHHVIKKKRNSELILNGTPIILLGIQGSRKRKKTRCGFSMVSKTSQIIKPV